jgi:CxxC motif-containing protein (DUF1111 family)
VTLTARSLGAALAFLVASPGCKREDFGPSQIVESGGADSVPDATRDAFSQPTPRLSELHRPKFFVGNSFFNQTWVTAPASVTARDGLGPLLNAPSCSTCHFKDGRSRPPDPGGKLETMLLRISVPGAGGAPIGDPVYGDQIQSRAIAGVAAEADVLVEYEEVPGAFADGERYTLRKPRYRLERLGYGPVAPGLLTSPRVAPVLVGLGLLEAVPQATLERLADPDDRDDDGISGRLNRVPDRARNSVVPGRFGWKAEQPSVLQQAASAFLGDMGLTSSTFPRENCQAKQEACRSAPNGGAPEVEPHVFEAIVLYARTLAVPARRNARSRDVAEGEALFRTLECASCHRPALRTERLADLPELDAQEIHPYTDLLLHDMGEGLSDGRPAFEAQGREWRTPPLWGIGLVQKVNQHTFFLHDGRARNLSEAILWHDGEARGARERFERLKREDRERLMTFLGDL